MEIGLNETCELLGQKENILILTHQQPDGDTLGSGFALARALCKLGKKVRLLCADPIPARYAYMQKGLDCEAFEPDFVVSVDVASDELLGEGLAEYHGKVDLCIDHHSFHRDYSKKLYLSPKAPATAMLIYDIVKHLNVEIDKQIAECIYTGIITDTGCFRYANTTPRSLIVAAELIEKGIDSSRLNRQLLEVKSCARIELEKLALNTIEYHLDGRCAIVIITRAMLEASGAGDDDLAGVTAMARQIEGVEIGILLREKAKGEIKVSVRSEHSFDAGRACAELGGGGHPGAAGCTVKGDLLDVRGKILDLVRRYITPR